MDPEILRQLKETFADVFRNQNRALLTAHALNGMLSSWDKGGAGRVYDIRAVVADAVAFADIAINMLEKESGNA